VRHGCRQRRQVADEIDGDVLDGTDRHSVEERVLRILNQAAPPYRFTAYKPAAPSSSEPGR
jgi:hypothetical protein